MKITKLPEKKGIIIQGDVIKSLEKLPDCSVDICVTSPPYWKLRDYEVFGQIGLEKEPIRYIKKLVMVFHEVKRVLKNTGTLWINIGDTYNGRGKSQESRPGQIQQSNKGSLIAYDVDANASGIKHKDLVGIPWMLSFALRDDGWYLRQDIIWSKKSVMPESVKDRFVKSHEYVFLLSKNRHYFFNLSAIREKSIDPESFSGRRKRKILIDRNGEVQKRGIVNSKEGKKYPYRNRRSVWEISSATKNKGHHASFPEKLVEICIYAGSKPNAIVIDPFFGSGTTGVVAYKCGRQWIGIDIKEDYCEMAKNRILGIKNEN